MGLLRGCGAAVYRGIDGAGNWRLRGTRRHGCARRDAKGDRGSGRCGQTDGLTKVPRSRSFTTPGKRSTLLCMAT